MVSQEFERNVIKTVVGLFLFVVGAWFFSSLGLLSVGPYYNSIWVGIVLAAVGAYLLYLSLRLFHSILKGIGSGIWK
jgi:uncharacterized membrane protein